jgi:hypothetical protein
MVAVAMEHNPLPLLYSTKVQYQPEPNSGSGDEYFDHPWEVLQRGWGDCDDLIIWRVGELIFRGRRAHARIIRIGVRYHTQVAREWDNVVEDPALKQQGLPWVTFDAGATYVYPPDGFLIG